MGQDVILRLRYIQTFTDRHGKTRTFLRRKGHKLIPLPDRASSDFLAAYQAAMASTEPPRREPRVASGSLEALVRSYKEGAAYQGLGASTRAVYDRIMAGLCRRHGTNPVAMLQPTHVRRLMAEMADRPAAANHLLRTLRSLMRHAVEEDWRADDPTAGVSRLAEVGEGAETWTDDDIAAYEAYHPPGSTARLALALLLYTGQRRSDVVRMGRQHIRDGMIDVRQEKTRTRLLIPIHPELVELLPPPSEHLTFLRTATGAAFTPNGFYMRFKGWVRAAGLPADRSPHGVRKAAARRMAEGGCTTHQIAAITGHKTLAEVQRYTRGVEQIRLAKAAVVHLGRGDGVKPLRRKVSNRP